MVVGVVKHWMWDGVGNLGGVAGVGCLQVQDSLAVMGCWRQSSVAVVGCPVWDSVAVNNQGMASWAAEEQ